MKYALLQRVPALATPTKEIVLESVLLEPKEKQDLIWKFSKAQNIEIACNVPGHYDVGMIAKVKITQ